MKYEKGGRTKAPITKVNDVFESGRSSGSVEVRDKYRKGQECDAEVEVQYESGRTDDDEDKRRKEEETEKG